jgi:hypothetical protein
VITAADIGAYKNQTQITEQIQTTENHSLPHWQMTLNYAFEGID